MSTTNYFVSLHHLAGPAGHAATLALWHRLRQAAPVGHISLDEAHRQAARLRLPPTETVQNGHDIFWTLDQVNGRLFLYTARRITAGLSTRLNTKRILTAYISQPVTVCDRRFNHTSTLAGTLLPWSPPPISTAAHMSMIGVGGKHIFIPPQQLDYEIVIKGRALVAFCLHEVEFIDLSPGLPVIHLTTPEITTVSSHIHESKSFGLFPKFVFPS